MKQDILLNKVENFVMKDENVPLKEEIVLMMQGKFENEEEKLPLDEKKDLLKEE